jgi:hypothetical protein
VVVFGRWLFIPFPLLFSSSKTWLHPLWHEADHLCRVPIAQHPGLDGNNHQPTSSRLSLVARPLRATIAVDFVNLFE